MTCIEGWITKSLGNTCKITTGKRDVNEGDPDGIYPFFTCSRINTFSNSYSFDTNAILIAGNGEVGILHRYDGKFEAYQRTYVLDSFSDDIDYIFQYISAYLKQSLLRSHVGSTIPFIKLGDLTDFPLEMPFLRSEQAKIAGILSTLDRAIEQTEDLIAKQQRIKSGLMNDLFTVGIDEHGNLRSFKTHKFEDTSLGFIPLEWQLKECAAICLQIVVGIVIRPVQYYKPDGVPVLRSANVQVNSIDPSNLVFMSQKDNKILRKSQIHKGDLVTVRTGYPGTTSVVPDEFESANCVDLVISRPDLTKVRSEFLSMWINSYQGLRQIQEGQGGLAQQHFNVREMKKLLVKVPSLDEQDRILKVLVKQISIIDGLKENLDKFYLLKTALMQDLLTGNKKVTELLNKNELLNV